MVSDTRFVRGAEKLSKRISTIRLKLALPLLTEEIGKLLYKRTMERFDKQVDPDGRPWRSLADATVAKRRALGFPGEEPILHRKGTLRNSIKLIRGRADGGIFFNTGAGIRIGITDPDMVEIGAVQNRGSNDGHIPARRFLGISALDIRAVDSFMRRRAAQVEASL